MPTLDYRPIFRTCQYGANISRIDMPKRVTLGLQVIENSHSLGACGARQRLSGEDQAEDNTQYKQLIHQMIAELEEVHAAPVASSPVDRRTTP